MTFFEWKVRETLFLNVFVVYLLCISDRSVCTSGEVLVPASTDGLADPLATFTEINDDLGTEPTRSFPPDHEVSTPESRKNYTVTLDEYSRTTSEVLDRSRPRNDTFDALDDGTNLVKIDKANTIDESQFSPDTKVTASSEVQNQTGGNLTCPTGWTLVEGSCYKLHFDPTSHLMLMSWRDARKYCRSYQLPNGESSDLATFDSVDVIPRVFHSNNSPTRDKSVLKRISEVWIGLRASSVARTSSGSPNEVWKWIDGVSTVERAVPWRFNMEPSSSREKYQRHHQPSNLILPARHHQHHQDLTIETKSQQKNDTNNKKNHHHRHGNHGHGRHHRPSKGRHQKLRKDRQHDEKTRKNRREVEHPTTLLGKHAKCGAVGPEFSDLYTFSVVGAPCEALKGFVCQTGAVEKRLMGGMEAIALIEPSLTTTEAPAAGCGRSRRANSEGKWFFHETKKCCYGFFGLHAVDSLNDIEDGDDGRVHQQGRSSDDLPLAWDAAKQRCTAMGGELASIEDYEEAAFVFQQAQRLAATTLIERFFIGLRRNSNDSFTWVDGLQSNYSAWNEGEPNYFGQQESCATMEVSNGYWNDENCGIPNPFVCKMRDGDEFQDSQEKIMDSKDKLTAEKRFAVKICPNGWKMYKEACFKLVFGSLPPSSAPNNGGMAFANWEQARETCRSLGEGADLASIHSQKENGFLHALFHHATHVQSNHSVTSMDAAWIGLSSKYFNGEAFYWTDETPVNFLDWDFPEPSWEDRHKRVHEECVALRLHGGQGFWNTMACNESLPFICRMPVKSLVAGEIEDTAPGDAIHGQQFCHGNLSDFTEFKGHCYRHFPADNHGKTWHKAESTCRSHGGHLVSINSPPEYHFVLSHLLPSSESNRTDERVWIGIKYDHSSHLLRWTDSWPLGFQRWEPGFNPQIFIKNQTFFRRMSNAGRNKTDLHQKSSSRHKHCFAMSMETGFWSPISDCVSTRLGFICEVDPSSPTVLRTSKNKEEKGVGGRCPIHGWLDMPSTSHCFWVEKTDMQVFDEARQKCISFGGDLASIHGEVEQDLVYSQLQDNIDVWIGLHKSDNGSLIWLDGTEMDYQRWALNEPNNRDEKCVEVYGSTGLWNDNSCSKFKGYVCKMAKVFS